MTSDSARPPSTYLPKPNPKQAKRIAGAALRARAPSRIPLRAAHSSLSAQPAETCTSLSARGAVSRLRPTDEPVVDAYRRQRPEAQHAAHQPRAAPTPPTQSATTPRPPNPKHQRAGGMGGRRGT